MGGGAVLRGLAVGILGVLVLGATGCRTPEERTKALHAKYDPWVADWLKKTDVELKKPRPAYQQIIRYHDNLIAHLVNTGDRTFHPKVAEIYVRNADIYDRIGQRAAAEKCRGAALKYDAGLGRGSAVVAAPPASGGGPVVVDPGLPPPPSSNRPPTVATPEPEPPAAPPAGGPDLPAVPAMENEIMARVAVLTLEEPPATREQYGYGSQFSGKLDAAFRKSRRFDMVNRSEVAAIIKERNLSESEYSAPEGAKRLGELLNVDYLIVGFVGPDKDHTMFNVSAKMVDTITGKEMAAVEGTTKQKEGIGGFSKLAEDLVKQLVSQHDTTPRQG